MKHWFKDQHFRSLLKNSSYLAVSRAVAAVCSLATLAFAGRGLGVMLFGTLILITSYARAASGLSKFQSWQLVVRYGGAGLASGNPEQFRTSTGFALALDVLSGIAGMIVAVLLLPFLGAWVGIKPEFLWLAMLYCTLLPTMGAATPNGVLRTLDRFDLISWAGTLTPITRALLVGTAFAMGAPFEAYVLIWYVTDIGGDLFMWFLAIRELRRRELLQGIRPTLRPTTLAGAWRFAIHINITVSITTAWGPIARLVVGGLLGPAGAALFRIASALADSAQKPADLLAKAFYPEVVRMDLSTKKPWRLMLRGTVLASAVAVLAVAILIVAGKPLVALLFGDEFLGAYPPLLVLIFIPLLGIFSFTMTPMLYALDRPDGPLKSKLAGTLVFFAIVAPLSWELGIIGAAIALVIGNVTAVAGLMWILVREYRRVRVR